MTSFFCGYHYFYPVTLTLESDLFSENFNLANNFSTVSVRLFVFHRNITCEKIFLLVLNLLIYLLKINVIHNKVINIKAFILHMSITCDKILVLVSRYLSL